MGLYLRTQNVSHNNICYVITSSVFFCELCKLPSVTDGIVWIIELIIIVFIHLLIFILHDE